MLRYEKSDTVAVVFKQGLNLVVPPFEVPSDQRVPGEAYEETAHRLARQVGVVGSVSHALQTSRTEGYPDRAYLMTGVYDEFADSDFLVPAINGESFIAQHPYLSDIDKELLRSALRCMEYRSL